jgi:hypothetical protein
MNNFSNKTKTVRGGRGKILMTGKIEDTCKDDDANMKYTSYASHVNVITKEEEIKSRKNIDADDTIPPSGSWQYKPLFIQTDKKRCNGLVVDGVGPNESVPLGKVFEFESDLFKGEGLIRIQRTKIDKNGTPELRNDENIYFKDRKRLYQVIIQGKFKEKIPVSDVVTGRYYDKPLQMTPPKFISRIVKKIISSVSPGVVVDLTSENPKVLSKLASAAQVLRADKEGSQPDISSFEDLTESPSIFGRRFSNSKQRKKILSDPNTQEYFDTDSIYTFELYDNIFDYWNYHVNMTVINMDMTKVVNQQPFHINAVKQSDRKYLWLFQIWHERLL